MGDAARVGPVKHGENLVRCKSLGLASHRLIRCIKGLQKRLFLIAVESHLMGLATKNCRPAANLDCSRASFVAQQLGCGLFCRLAAMLRLQTWRAGQQGA